MEVRKSYGDDEVAKVHVGVLRGNDRYRVEFVESLQPPRTRQEKQVVIVSSLFGCPVDCAMCDAGGDYHGKLTADEILAQVDHVVRSRFPGGNVGTDMLKIQFARVGEPTLNPAVLDALRMLPERYQAPLVPCISSIAPKGCEAFFSEAKQIKDALYPGGRFQLQFSIHTTDWEKRRELIPAETLTMPEMARLGAEWHEPGDRKVTLNFAPAKGYPVDPAIVAEHFDPAHFLIKLTPVNPTRSMEKRGLVSVIDPDDPASAKELVDGFEAHGFDVILSIGEVRENQIGSNCGMYLGGR